MPNLKQLKKRVEFLIDDTLEDDMLLELMNEALEDLSEAVGYELTASAEFQKGESIISLPSDFIKLIEFKIKLDGDSEFVRVERKNLKNDGDVLYETYSELYSSFEEYGDSLTVFPDPKTNGEFLIRYYGMIPRLKLLEECADQKEYNEQTPKLPVRYHKALPLYVAVRYWQNWKDEPQQVGEFKQEYATLKNEMSAEKTIRDYKNRSKTVYRYNDFI